MQRLLGNLAEIWLDAHSHHQIVFGPDLGEDALSVPHVLYELLVTVQKAFVPLQIFNFALILINNLIPFLNALFKQRDLGVEELNGELDPRVSLENYRFGVDFLIHQSSHLNLAPDNLRIVVLKSVGRHLLQLDVQQVVFFHVVNAEGEFDEGKSALEDGRGVEVVVVDDVDLRLLKRQVLSLQDLSHHLGRLLSLCFFFHLQPFLFENVFFARLYGLIELVLLLHQLLLDDSFGIHPQIDELFSRDLPILPFVNFIVDLGCELPIKNVALIFLVQVVEEIFMVDVALVVDVQHFELLF